MANFRVRYYTKNGYAGDVSFAVIEKGMLPEDKLKILRPGAELLLQRLRDFLAANTNDPNAEIRGRLAESLKAVENSTIGSIIVTPRGVHHGKKARRKRSEGYRRARTGQGRGRSSKSAHHGMTGGTSAVDVGYYLEYGTPRMAALHWMETVNEQSDADIQAELEAAWDQYLKSLGL